MKYRARPRPTALLSPRSSGKPEAATAVVELLMMGVRMSETCWAVFKRQVINLRHCCIWLVDSLGFSVDLKWPQFLRNVFIKNISCLKKNRWQIILLSVRTHRAPTLKLWRWFSWIHCGFSVLLLFCVCMCSFSKMKPLKKKYQHRISSVVWTNHSCQSQK